MNNFGEKVSFIWSVADLLRGPYRPNQYKDVMLPMKRKQPYFIYRRDGAPIFFAGLWDRWDKGDGGPLDFFAIVTTSANPHVAEVHDRMLALVDARDHALWLDPEVDDPARLLPLLEPYPGTELPLTPVSTYVNNPRNDHPRCIEPLSHPTSG